MTSLICELLTSTFSSSLSKEIFVKNLKIVLGWNIGTAKNVGITNRVEDCKAGISKRLISV
jgi:hypothetical protein